MPETRLQPETPGRDTRAQTVRLGSMARTVAVPGWYPDDASDSIHPGLDVAETDRAFQELRAASAARGTGGVRLARGAGKAGKADMQQPRLGSAWPNVMPPITKLV